MGKFIKVKIREREEGQPGFAKYKEMYININPAYVTLFNKGAENEDITFVRMACGITICVVMSKKKFAQLLEKTK